MHFLLRQKLFDSHIFDTLDFNLYLMCLLYCVRCDAFAQLIPIIIWLRFRTTYSESIRDVAVFTVRGERKINKRHLWCAINQLTEFLLSFRFISAWSGPIQTIYVHCTHYTLHTTQHILGCIAIIFFGGTHTSMKSGAILSQICKDSNIFNVTIFQIITSR